MTRKKSYNNNAAGIDGRRKVDPNAKRVNGWLTCDTCLFTVPYAGFEDAARDERPRHRCVRDVRDFDRFTLKEPRRSAPVHQPLVASLPPLPKVHARQPKPEAPPPDPLEILWPNGRRR